MLPPEALRAHYSAFLEPRRVLLTGHSHQAWPDAARAGILECFDDAARLADDKWPAAFAAADAVRAHVAEWIGAQPSEIALAANTHELVGRFLSALDLKARPRLVTTTGEFHTITRQLRRLEETGLLEVVWVSALPAETLVDRLAAATDERTAAVLTSTVLFETASQVPYLGQLVAHARARGAEVLLDAYHAFAVVPFTLTSLGAEDAFVVAGGYKYAQWGEGNCFLRVPPARPFRPVLSGWFAGFAELGALGAGVSYGASGAEAFAGSTWDPVSVYRARAVIRFFAVQGMTLAALRERSLRQTQRLLDGLGGFEVVTPRDEARRGGFVAVKLPGAAQAVEALRNEQIVADARGPLLRLGPAPYVTDGELDRGLKALLRFR